MIGTAGVVSAPISQDDNDQNISEQTSVSVPPRKLEQYVFRNVRHSVQDD